MRGLVFCLTVALAMAGTSYAQTATGSIVPEVLRGSSAASKNTSQKSSSTSAKKVTPVAASANSTVVAKPPVQRAAAARSAQRPQSHTTPESLRGSRYGGFAPTPAGPPPVLDTTSPRSFSLVNFNTKEELTVTYWSNGAYHRDALDKLNHFLRDSQNNSETEMDPLLFDVLWHTMQVTGFNGTVEVLSGFRSPTTNAWLASVSRGVARDSQHMNGNAMDIRFPGVAVYRIRQAAYSLSMGGVGFYPRSGFVHLDTGPVRYW
jgi:uncharacterized protein YcbK (DUF882 family)